MKQATQARGKGAGGKTIRPSGSPTGRRNTTRRAPASKARRSTPVIASTPPVPIRLIQWTNTRWNALEAHHQQQIRSICLLILSLLLFASLTICQTVPLLSGINHVFLLFFGWSAYLLALGLIAFAVAHLVEGIRKQPLVRPSLLAGLVFLYLLLLMESALIAGQEQVGLLGEILVLPLSGWPRGVDHVLVLGALLIASIVTFRLRIGHLRLFVHYGKRLFASSGTDTPQIPDLEDSAQPAEIEPAQGRIIVKLRPELDPLASNPHPIAKDEKITQFQSGRNGQVKAHTKEQGVRTPIQPVCSQQSPWKLPGTSLLRRPMPSQRATQDPLLLAQTIQATLRSLRVDAEVRAEDISIGPTVIRFGIRPTGKPEKSLDEKTGKMEVVKDAANNIVYETRTRVSRIMAIQNDLALALAADAIRMEAPVPGRPYVGVEIPNKNSRLVTLREVLETSEYQTAQARSKLAVGLGCDVAGQVCVGDLAKMPHLLIAGSTGSGKSVCLNTIIASLLLQATPDDVRLLMVDPKMVELSMYNGIPHLLSPVETEANKVVSLLKEAITEMERRYRLFSQLGVRNLDSYRKLAQKDASLDNLPSIVLIIDELADLMMAAANEVEGMICRLAQLARATGIHLIVATQRPSVDVITGLIKANIPTRISFMVSSSVDSRTILDMGGAEKLLGRGDMLYLEASASRPERIQGAFLSDEEAQHLADYWRRQCSVIAQPK
jgi:hypothetical protein